MVNLHHRKKLSTEIDIILARVEEKFPVPSLDRPKVIQEVIDLYLSIPIRSHRSDILQIIAALFPLTIVGIPPNGGKQLLSLLKFYWKL